MFYEKMKYIYTLEINCHIMKVLNGKKLPSSQSKEVRKSFHCTRNSSFRNADALIGSKLSVTEQRAKCKMKVWKIGKISSGIFEKWHNFCFSFPSNCTINRKMIRMVNSFTSHSTSSAPLQQRFAHSFDIT